MTTIAVDIDEVLADTIKSMMEKYNYTWKWKKVSFDDLTNYNLWEIEKLWMTKNQALWIFIKHQLFSWITKKIPPIKWAKEKLMELKSKWYKIYAVTARFSFMSFSTKRWIKKNFPDCFEWIIFADFFTKYAKKKSDLCKKVWATIMIEDNLETCIDCENNWIMCFLFDKPWNKEFSQDKHKWIKKISSRNEINI